MAPPDRPPSASSTQPRCPGCGEPVDPLRAGHVAILSGGFHYFCSAACKVDYLRAVAAQLSDDVETAEPPPVAPPRAERGSGARTETSVAPASAAASVSVSVSASDRGAARTAFPEASPVAPATGASSRDAAPSDAAPSDAAPGVARVSRSKSSAPPPVAAVPPASPPPVARETPPPARPPSDAPRRAAATEMATTKAAPSPRSHRARERERERAPGALSALGMATGLLAAVAALTPLAWMALALAFGATMAVALRTLRRTKDVADAHSAAALVPVVVAFGGATWGFVAGDPHAPAISALAGISAAVLLAVEILVTRARAELESARGDIADGLAAKARVVRGDERVEVDANDVKPGEQVVVGPGEIVPVDATILAGDAEVLPWRGATTATTKHEGDAVVAGAKILTGTLRLSTTWSGDERAWARLVLSPSLRVDVAAPMAKVARAITERGAPGAALLVGVAAYVSNATPWEVLGAAAAAALACSASGVVAIVALAHARGQLAALEHGIVYKDARAFDRAGRTDVAVLSARGTILSGEPDIVALEAVGAIDADRLLAYAAGAETASTHPFARAILRATRVRGQRPDNVRSATTHAGLGVTALTSAGERLVVGSRALLLQERVSCASADARIAELEAEGRSVILVALGEKLVGWIALQDALRPGARAAVQRLHEARVEPVLLSGEARETCESLGRSIDVEHIRPEVLPGDRGTEVRALAEGGHVVAVLGRPALDDAALGAADVSVALGAAGATAGEWAIALASEDVRDAAHALGLAHATRDRARLALILGLAPGAAALLAIGFGLAPYVFGPLAAIAGTGLALRQLPRATEAIGGARAPLRDESDASSPSPT